VNRSFEGSFIYLI